MSDKRHKKYVGWYFLGLATLSLLLVGSIAVTFYIVDPLQFFHRSHFLPEDMLSTNMREQAPGLLRNYDHDSIILGSSMLENTSADEASRKLGGKFLNVSVRASDFYERSFVLDNAFKQELKNVIYSLDHFYLYCSMGNADYDLANWTGLYGKNPFRFFLHYATRENFLNLFSENKGLSKVHLEYPVAWKFQPEFFNAFGGLDKWAAQLHHPHMQATVVKDILERAEEAGKQDSGRPQYMTTEEEIRAYLEKYLLKYVYEHPETNFYLIFPPYYRLTYAKWLKFEPDQFKAYLDSIRYLVGKSDALPNLHIYGFEDQDFLDDIANYADPYHYHPKYNDQMLEAIKNGTELNSSNIESYLQKISAKAASFDFDAFVKKLRGLLESSSDVSSLFPDNALEGSYL